ncbi:MAG TPA: hypothetical protein ENK85_04935 [Saprospiraceae bacterium]|nr:hypothetical protein [Saprospiraceae bacterium]
MKDKKSKKIYDNPLFRKENKGHAHSAEGASHTQEVLQEYTLWQFFWLKLQSLSQRAVFKLKHIVFDSWRETLKSTFFWKTIAFLLVAAWARSWSQKVQVHFQWPVVVSTGLVSSQDNPVQEMNFLPVFDQNQAAPKVNLKRQKAENYIRHYAKVAIAEHKKFGIPASIKMAQALVESRAGESTLARKNHNHFGIKCFSRKCKAGHCSNLTDDSHKDFFRIYHSAWESWRAHSQLLMSKKYKPLLKYGDDYKAWAKGLKKLGYATDKNYDKKLIQIIETYKLYRLDAQ